MRPTVARDEYVRVPPVDAHPQRAGCLSFVVTTPAHRLPIPSTRPFLRSPDKRPYFDTQLPEHPALLSLTLAAPKPATEHGASHRSKAISSGTRCKYWSLVDSRPRQEWVKLPLSGVR